MIIWTVEAGGGQPRPSTKMPFLKMSRRDKIFVFKISSGLAACAQYSGKNSSLKMQSLEKSGFCSAGLLSMSRSRLGGAHFYF